MMTLYMNLFINGPLAHCLWAKNPSILPSEDLRLSDPKLHLNFYEHFLVIFILIPLYSYYFFLCKKKIPISLPVIRGLRKILKYKIIFINSYNNFRIFIQMLQASIQYQSNLSLSSARISHTYILNGLILSNITKYPTIYTHSYFPINIKLVTVT